MLVIVAVQKVAARDRPVRLAHRSVAYPVIDARAEVRAAAKQDHVRIGSCPLR